MEEIEELEKEEKIKNEEEKNEYIENISENEENIENELEKNFDDKDKDTLCTKSEIKNNKCNSIITDDQTKELYNELKHDLIKGNYTKKKDNIIVQTGNVVFQLSTLKDQKSMSNLTSIVDLGDCEKILKNKYKIPENTDLIILKTEALENEIGSRYVQYEIYEPFSLHKLDLKYCEGTKIEINIPVKLDNSTQTLYEESKSQGYNIFDSNDDFYNDICTPYTSENGTDLTISLRQSTVYKPLCQDNCLFNSFNSSFNRASCSCDAQKNETKTEISEIKKVTNLFFGSFYNVIKISNFLVIKCYKLAFKINFSDVNIGRIIMSVLSVLCFILIIICCFKNDKKLSSFIQIVLKIRFSNNNINNKNNNNKKLNNSNKNGLQSRKGKTNKNSKIIKNNLTGKIKKVKFEKTKKKSKILNINKSKENKKNKKTNDSTQKNLIKLKEPPKKVEYEKRKFLNKIQKNDSILIQNKIKINDFSIEPSNKFLLENNKQNKKKKYTNNIASFVFTKKNIKIINNKKNVKNNKNESNKKNNKQKNLVNNRKMLNSYELNGLEYREAIILDKRTYCQYYCDCLKQRQLLFFSFYSENDYNLRLMKILLFILSFSLYFTITAFFFADNTMNKIVADNGKYNFISQLPQMIYSSLVTTVINVIIKNLSLSEKNILLLKKEKSLKLAYKKSKDINSGLKIKFSIFYVLGIVLMIFYWYFITCFCAVYRNTQIILIKNTIFSFLMSMTYPFGIELLPGIFRITALKAERKDKKCMFIFGNFLALF